MSRWKLYSRRIFLWSLAWWLSWLLRWKRCCRMSWVTFFMKRFTIVAPPSKIYEASSQTSYFHVPSWICTQGRNISICEGGFDFTIMLSYVVAFSDGGNFFSTFLFSEWLRIYNYGYRLTFKLYYPNTRHRTFCFSSLTGWSFKIIDLLASGEVFQIHIFSIFPLTAPCNESTEYRCPEGLCIPQSYLCDAYPYDCANNFDESDEMCEGILAGFFLNYLWFTYHWIFWSDVPIAIFLEVHFFSTYPISLYAASHDSSLLQNCRASFG